MSHAARRRSGRTLLSLLAGFLMVLVASQSALAAVAWTSPVNAGPVLSWNFGRGLARTSAASTSYLHVQYEDDRHAPAGIYYRRGNASGSSWGTAKRLNPSTSNAESGAIAAASHYVYVAYTTGRHAAANYNPAAPRLVRVRINTNHGASNAWLTAKKSETPTRAGRPALAATGSYVYLAVTDADTGDIQVASNNGVNNEDVGWTATSVGVTTRQSTFDGDGFEANPVVAASGARVLVAWIDADTGTIKAKISTDHGHHWPADATTLATGQVYGLSAAGDGGRLALAWAQPNGIKLRLFVDGAWRATKTVAGFSPTARYRNGYGTSVAMSGTARIGVAWSACTRASCAASSTQGVDVRWRESTNNGGAWKSPLTIASHGAAKGRRVNDYPSAVMTDSPKRFVAYNTASASLSTYRLVIEAGSGKP